MLLLQAKVFRELLMQELALQRYLKKRGLRFWNFMHFEKIF